MGSEDLLFKAGLENSGFLKGIAGMVGGLFTLGKAADLLKDMSQKAEINETATMGLASAVKSLKDGTESGFLSLTKYADKMSETTGIAKSDLTNALKTLVYETGNTAAAQSSLTAAIDISQAKHVSLEVAAKAVGKAYEGNTTMLKRWGIELKDGEHGLQAVSDLTKTFGGAEDSYLATTAGKLKVAQENFNALENEIGKNFLPAMGKAAQAITEFLQYLGPNGAKILEMKQHIHFLNQELEDLAKQKPSFKNLVDMQGIKLQITETTKGLNDLGGAWNDATNDAQIYGMAVAEGQGKDKDNAHNAAKDKKKTQEEELNATGQFFKGLTALSKTKNKELFEIGKAASIGEIIFDTARAIMKTWAEVPFPFNIAAAAGLAVEGGVQVAEASSATFSAANGLYNDTGESMISTFKPQEMVIPQVFSEGIMSGKYSLHGGDTSTETHGDTIIHVNAGNKSIEQTLREVKTYVNNNRGGRLTRTDGSLNV